MILFFERFTHLQHTPFTYTINVNNKKTVPTTASCRIFIAPKGDEKGEPIPLKDQRLLMAEMDRFTTTR